MTTAPILPLKLLRHMLDAVTPAVWVTYGDLFPEGHPDWDYRACYPVEAALWGVSRPVDRPTVLVQHDEDRGWDMLADVLAVRPDVPRHCQLWAGRRLERAGVEVGYHFDVGQDVAQWRREAVGYRFCGAHGGPKGNVELPLDPQVMREVGCRWVSNGFGVQWHKQWSDGGLMKAARDAVEARDPFVFLSRVRPGGRYRMLFHPQYYGEKPTPVAEWRGIEWYERALSL